MIMPKFYAACGVAGFGLSFLTGLFSGASFGLVLVRALVFGAVFATLAVLFHFLLKRFVPDLFDKDYAATAETTAPSANLDITIADEDGASLEEDSAVPDFMKSRSGGKSGEGSGMEARGNGSEAGAEGFSAGGNGGAGADASTSPRSEPGSERPDFALGQNTGDDGLDAEMPDVSDFENPEDFASDEAAAGTVSYNGPSFSPDSGDSSLFASDSDVGTMAKAIRTVLSKE